MSERPRMLPAALLVLVSAVGLGATLRAGPEPADGPPSPTAAPGAEAIAEAARAFVQRLDGPRREKAVFAFADDERFDFHFIPRERRGLPLGEMTPVQRDAAHRLLRTTLSSQGYNKAVGVMRLEQILGTLEGRPERRDPERYFFSVFGTPSTTAPWGWRFEGHHVTLNFTSAGGVTVGTPAFLGANPAMVPSGPFAGWRLLGAEEELGRDLVLSLDATQRTRAVIAAEAFPDIVTGADRRVSLEGYEGLPASAMSAEQRELLWRLLREYVQNMEPGISRAQLAKIEDAGIGRVHFAWAGSTVPGEGHYYRVHGPTLLLEYDNTQNAANHVHSVWRDLTDDFGDDLLGRHYREAEHHRSR